METVCLLCKRTLLCCKMSITGIYTFQYGWGGGGGAMGKGHVPEIIRERAGGGFVYDIRFTFIVFNKICPEYL